MKSSDMRHGAEPLPVHRGRCQPTAPRGGALRLDRYERQVLEVVRYILVAFVEPDTEAWMQAFWLAERKFPSPHGAKIAYGIVVALRLARDVRTDPMLPGDPLQPSEPNGMPAMNDCERHFLTALHAMRRNDIPRARVAALLLCEGAPADDVLTALERLAVLTGDGASCETSS